MLNYVICSIEDVPLVHIHVCFGTSRHVLFPCTRQLILMVQCTIVDVAPTERRPVAEPPF